MGRYLYLIFLICILFPPKCDCSTLQKCRDFQDRRFSILGLRARIDIFESRNTYVKNVIKKMLGNLRFTIVLFSSILPVLKQDPQLYLAVTSRHSVFPGKIRDLLTFQMTAHIIIITPMYTNQEVTASKNFLQGLG